MSQYPEATLSERISKDTSFFTEAVKAYKQGRLKDAFQLLRELASASPQDPLPIRMQGEIYKEANAYIDAAKTFSRAATLSGSPDDSLAAAQCYFLARKLHKCEFDLIKLLDQHPNHDEARELYTRVELARGNWLGADDQQRFMSPGYRSTNSFSRLARRTQKWVEAIASNQHEATGFHKINSQLPVYIMQDFLSPKDCQSLLDLAAANPENEARVGNGRLKENIRRSKVRWIHNTYLPSDIAEKIYSALGALATQLGTTLDEIEHFQVGEYSADYRGHYGWHIDSNSMDQGSVRRLSIAIQLSNPANYAGGLLQFENNELIVSCPRALGLVAIFPSDLRHQVTPVVQGTRHSLVGWARGPLVQSERQLSIVR